MFLCIGAYDSKKFPPLISEEIAVEQTNFNTFISETLIYSNVLVERSRKTGFAKKCALIYGKLPFRNWLHLIMILLDDETWSLQHLCNHVQSKHTRLEDSLSCGSFLSHQRFLTRELIISCHEI